MYNIPNNIVIHRTTHRIGFGDDRYREFRRAKDGPHGFIALSPQPATYSACMPLPLYKLISNTMLYYYNVST